MNEKIRSLWEKYGDILIYLVFGVLTTVVNYLVYLPAYNIVHLSGALSNIIAWAAAVVFAFVTNKPFVFKSHDWSWKVVGPELTKFISCRLASGAMETGIVFVAVDVLGGNGNIWKLLTSVLVVILNYFGSKLLVFRKK